MTYWLNENSRAFLGRDYLKEGETAESRIRDIVNTAGEILNIPGYSSKLEEYIHAGFISLSSPIWSNFGRPKVLGISCNGSYMADDMESILLKTAEIGRMTQRGAGTSVYISALRGRGEIIQSGGVADGPTHYLGLVQEHVNTVSQSNIRRGNCAAYMDIEHPDIMEYLDCREEGNHIQHLSLGVCVGREWLREMKAGDSAKRKIWMRLLKKRFESGYPYIFFRDNVNDQKPQVLKDKNIPIHASNLCAEIALPSSEIWSFVCDLLSLNALHYHAWKDTDLVEVACMLLDAVMTEYIQKTDGDFLMSAANRFARDWRAIGVGVLGYHSLLQSRMIPWESEDARSLNIDLFKTMSEQSLEASKKMAKTHGEPDMMIGYGERWLTRHAIAPTTSSAFILGQVSPSTEPENSNYYTKDLAKGKFSYRNPWLVRLLEARNMNDEETWRSILMAGGSVQHLFNLTAHEKDVFKTFGEINQGEIIKQAADRQPYIDQSQSLNLMIHPDTELRDVNALVLKAEEMGIKSLYYQRSTNKAQELVRDLVSCRACEA